MRRLKLQVQTIIDGYMAGPDGEMDWVTYAWNDDMNSYVEALSQSVDCIVLGRNLAEGFIPHWASRPEDEDEASIDWMNNTPKVVISNTLQQSSWDNAEVAGGDLTETVNRLKGEPGGDLIVYGGAALVRDLLARALVDDLHLFVNPTAIGSGMPVFPSTGTPNQFNLVEARPFDCGITVLQYQPRRPQAATG